MRLLFLLTLSSFIAGQAHAQPRKSTRPTKSPSLQAQLQEKERTIQILLAANKRQGEWAQSVTRDRDRLAGALAAAEERLAAYDTAFDTLYSYVKRGESSPLQAKDSSERMGDLLQRRLRATTPLTATATLWQHEKRSPILLELR